MSPVVQPEVPNQAWVTLATNDSYALGALVLANSLRRVGTKRSVVVMVTPNVTPSMRELLGSNFNCVQMVDVLDSADSANLALLKRPELGITLTKLHCWTLTQYEKAVFMDADTMVVQSCDEIFEREELSAAPDMGWPDSFNSGVFVFSPSMDTYGKLLEFAAEKGSYDGGDQGLLNMFFSDWSTKDIQKHLPFIYNMVVQQKEPQYTSSPAYNYFGQNAKIVHFLGSLKPWHHYYNPSTRQVTVQGGQHQMYGFIQTWWDIFADNVLPQLGGSYSGLARSLETTLRISDGSAKQASSLERLVAWESGQADYTGADSFSNIQKKLEETIAKAQEKSPTPTPPTSSPPS